jgi:NADPH:quinone reductase-like Zn-dependent oxidoreductase
VPLSFSKRPKYDLSRQREAPIDDSSENHAGRGSRQPWRSVPGCAGPQPDPQPGQVLVRIEASAVNPLDIKIRACQAAHARQPLPAILGIDLAGVVEAVGSGVTSFRHGDEVYGMTGGVGGLQGSLAEYAVVDADLLAPKPANLSMREAAALPLIFITAWEGLVDRAAVHSGQRC